MRHIRRAALFTAAIATPAIGLVAGARAQQPYTWRLMGRLPAIVSKWEGYCGFFWNSQIGVVANTTQFFYTRDGHTWTPSLSFPKGAWINSIRCFDGHTLYAPVMYGGRDGPTYDYSAKTELWTSPDRGVTWTSVTKTNAAYGIDVYWSTITNSPALSNALTEWTYVTYGKFGDWRTDQVQGTTIARLDSLRLAATFDDDRLALPIYSIDGGVKWYAPASLPGDPPPPCGYGIAADTLHKLYYYAHESNSPALSVSSNGGAHWTQLTNLPASQNWNDDVESGGGRTYIQTYDGLYVTGDEGLTWDFIHGPGANFDDSHFCVLGCHGQTVIAFDIFGGIWISNEWDAPGPTLMHSDFQTSALECDTSVITIGLDSSTAPGIYLVTIVGDTDGVFKILGSDTITISKIRHNILVQFHAQDIKNHSAIISLIPMTDAVCQTGDRHAIAGRAYLGPPHVTVLSPVVVCSSGSSKIYVSNPACDSLLIQSVSTDPSITVLPFDSVIRGLDSISLTANPASSDTSIRSLIHFTGKYLPSDSAFDATVDIVVKTTHIRSTLGWPSSTALAFAQPTSCDPIDTMIVLWNTGCDTITVDLDQLTAIANCWRVTSESGIHVLSPGQADTIHIRFFSKLPGIYPLALTYTYTDGASRHDSIRFNLEAVVPPVQQQLSLFPGTVDLGSRAMCSDTSLPVRLQNLGCDSAIVSNVHFASGSAFLLISATDSVILPNGEIDETIIYYPTRHGVALDTLYMHIESTDSTYSMDTSILCRVEVTRGAAFLASAADSYNLDTTTICQERDTFVVIENMGCDTVCDSSVAITPNTFTLAKGWSARCLAPGERDTVWLSTRVDTSGHPGQNLATLTITSNADTALPPITLAREIQYPAVWRLSISMPDSVYPGQAVTYKLLQHGTLPTDDTAIDFVLHYDDDLLQFLSKDEPFVSAQAHAGGIALHVAPPPTDSVLTTLHFTAFLAPNQHTRLLVDSVAFSSQPAWASDCIALAQVDSSAFTIRTLCGANEMLNELNGLPLTLDGIVPNPSHNDVTLYYSLAGSENAFATVQLEDGLGRKALTRSVTLSSGLHQTIAIDLSGIPSGVYLVRLGAANSKRIVKE